MLGNTAVSLGIGVVAVAAMLVTAPTASAVPAQPLPTPSISVKFLNGLPLLDVTGTGCVDASGKPGAVIITYTQPGRAASTLTLSQGFYDGAGGWHAEIGINSAVPGTYTAAVSCDLYNSQSTYPTASTSFIDPKVSIASKTVYAGQKFLISVIGYLPNSNIEATWIGGKLPGLRAAATIASGTTDASGDATLVAVMDPNVLEGPSAKWLDQEWQIGIFTLTPDQLGYAPFAYTSVILLAAPSAGPQLANTGVNASGLSAVGAGLLLTGGLSLAIGRRRR